MSVMLFGEKMALYIAITNLSCSNSNVELTEEQRQTLLRIMSALAKELKFPREVQDIKTGMPVSVVLGPVIEQLEKTLNAYEVPEMSAERTVWDHIAEDTGVDKG